MKRLPLFSLLFLFLFAGTLRAADTPPVALDQLTEKTGQSLVLVEYTWKNENVSREEYGQGLVLNKDGLILISGGLIPEFLPKDYIQDIRIRVPADGFTTVKAQFLGRTVNRIFAYLKTEKPINVEPIDISEHGDPIMGQEVASVGRMDKQGAYTLYLGTSRVKAMLSLTQQMIFVGSFGLTRATSPVFDLQTGTFLGLVYPPLPESMTLAVGEAAQRVTLRDDEQSAVFLPWSEVKDILTADPKEPFESPRPWLGIVDVAGIEEDMRNALDLGQTGGVTIGAVVAGQPAEKAGLQARDVILAVNGKPVTDSIVPEVMLAHFRRQVEELPLDKDATLTILRDGQKQDITVHVEASPKEGYEMAHVFNKKLGITTRNLAFSDLYQRKLPQDTKGVMVALVKNGSPAGLGSTPVRAGMLITKINDQDVTDQASCESIMKDLESNLDLKEVVLRVIRPDGETQVCRIDLTK